jgi:hypothetical protein
MNDPVHAVAFLDFMGRRDRSNKNRDVFLLEEIRFARKNPPHRGTPTSYILGDRAMRPKRIIENHFRSSLRQVGRPSFLSTQESHSRGTRSLVYRNSPSFAYGPGPDLPDRQKL